MVFLYQGIGVIFFIFSGLWVPNQENRAVCGGDTPTVRKGTGPGLDAGSTLSPPVKIFDFATPLVELRLSQKIKDFFRKCVLQAAACSRCPLASNCHTGSLRRVFPDAQVAGKNGFDLFSRQDGKLCEAFEVVGGGRGGQGKWAVRLTKLSRFRASPGVVLHCLPLTSEQSKIPNF